MELKRVWVSAVLLLAAATGCSLAPGPDHTDPLAPQEALQSFQIVEGFAIELFASEPLVADPVEIAFDENGAAFIAEMYDYPFDPAAGETPRSGVRLLRDSDGDGVADRSTVFARDLRNVTSVLPWKGGLFVTAAPDILYLKDLDGDDEADLRECWYTGFNDQVSSETRITNLRLGLDNWIYAGNSAHQGTITSPRLPDHAPVLVRGFDFRFHPVTGRFEPAGGPTQFGSSFNEWGERFVSQNTQHLRHVVLPARYILHSPVLRVPVMLQDVSDHGSPISEIFPLTQPQEWRQQRTRLRQQPYDELGAGRQELVGGHFTAATGATIYVGDAFPEDFRGNAFVADANGNIAHRDILAASAATFRASRWPSDAEFLASRDRWFRPVNFANAPDGNLYIVDFYREYIEEPASIPESLQSQLQLDFYRGTDLGRMYRIRSRADGGRVLSSSSLGRKAASELIPDLAHPNGWLRRNAQRLLVERADRSVAEALRRFSRGPTTPLGLIHSLWTLQGLGALQIEDLQVALSDSDARVRRHGLRLSETMLESRAVQRLLRSLLPRLFQDEEPRIVFQAVLTTGLLEENRSLIGLLAEVATAAAEPTPVESYLVKQLSMVAGASRDSSDIVRLLKVLSGHSGKLDDSWNSACVSGLVAGLDLIDGEVLRLLSARTLLSEWLDHGSPALRVGARRLARHIHLPHYLERAPAEVLDAGLSQPIREAALSVLRRVPWPRAVPLLREVLRSPVAQSMKVIAVRVLDSFEETGALEMLMDHWNLLSPALQRQSLEAIMQRPEWTLGFLNAVQAGRVRSDALDASARGRLLDHPSDRVQLLAERLLGGVVKQDRAGAWSSSTVRR